jgi:hypothetical protein
MKFVQDRPFANPEAAARKLLELVLQQDIDVGQFTNIGKINRAFLDTGGSVLEYVAGCGYAIDSQWFKIDPSGSRIILLDAGLTGNRPRRGLRQAAARPRRRPRPARSIPAPTSSPPFV